MKKKTPFPNLNGQQRKQVLKQLENHQHKSHVTDFVYTPWGNVLKNFHINEFVFNPTGMTSRYLALYLFMNNQCLFAGKRVLDMGTGTGLMAITMAKHGASEVIASDISPLAVGNTQANIKQFKLQDKITVVLGDLFENITGKFDFIIFNHPFFGDDPMEGNTIAASMLNNGALIQRFLKEVPDFLNPHVPVMMPFYSIAGAKNDPVIQGLKYGFNVQTTFTTNAGTGLQTGEITIHELTKR